MPDHPGPGPGESASHRSDDLGRGSTTVSARPRTRLPFAQGLRKPAATVASASGAPNLAGRRAGRCAAPFGPQAVTIWGRPAPRCAAENRQTQPRARRACRGSPRGRLAPGHGCGSRVACVVVIAGHRRIVRCAQPAASDTRPRARGAALPERDGTRVRAEAERRLLQPRDDAEAGCAKDLLSFGRGNGDPPNR